MSDDTGYHAALCAEMVSPQDAPVKESEHVCTIERLRSLVNFAIKNLECKVTPIGFLSSRRMVLWTTSIGFDRVPYATGC